MSFKSCLVLLHMCSFFFHASCINDYGCCKPARCEVSARTESGWVCGNLRLGDDGNLYDSFLGVPYGRPPLGRRRFKELEPVIPWEGFFDATEDPPACPQSDFVNGRMPLQKKGQKEDCIYLNIHVSRSSPNKNMFLPVLVFIHGGTLQSGSCLTDIFGPEYLMSRPVVIITINYRLNVFGFLSLGTKEIPGNQGLRDMLSALRWVRRNVAAFGGDPDNVTLMGQSAGATAVHLLSLSKAAKGLFQRVILMSGTAFPKYFTTSPKYAKEVAKMFLQEVGINSTDSAYIHDQLTEMPLLKIMAANVAVQYKTGFTSFGAVEDSECPGNIRVVEGNPLALMAKGRGREYPAIVSFTNNEIHYARWLLTRKNVLGLLQKDRTAIVEPRLLLTLSKDEISEIAEKIYDRYFNGADATLEGLMTYYTDLIFKYPAFKLAQWRVATGGAPTFMYHYPYEALVSVIKEAHWVEYDGAAHGDDLAFVFRVNSMMGNHTIYPMRNRDDAMKDYMVYLITNFMACGNPLCFGGKWPPVAKGRIVYNEIKQPYALSIKGPTRAQREMVAFYDSIDPEVREISATLGAGWN